MPPAMRTWFALILLLLASPLVRAGEACAPQRAAVFTAGDAKSELLIVPADFGGRPARLLVDTGSDWSLMTERFARQLGLTAKRLRRPYLDVAGGRIHYYVTVSRFTLGPLALSGEFVVMPGRDGSEELYEATIGARALSAFDVEIDGATGTVTLYRPDVRCAGRLVHWAERWSEIPIDFDEEIPEIHVVLDGKPVRAVLDTGASHSLMDTAFARRAFGLAPTSPGVMPRGTLTLASGTTAALHSYRFGSLAVADLTFDNVEVMLGDFAVVPFTLGMREIRQLHLYIAFKRKMIYATRISRR